MVNYILYVCDMYDVVVFFSLSLILPKKKLNYTNIIQSRVPFNVLYKNKKLPFCLSTLKF